MTLYTSREQTEKESDEINPKLKTIQQVAFYIECAHKPIKPFYKGCKLQGHHGEYSFPLQAAAKQLCALTAPASTSGRSSQSCVRT